MRSPYQALFIFFIIPQVLGKINYCHQVRNCGHIENIVCKRKHMCGPTDNCEAVKLKRSTKIYIIMLLNEHRNDVALGRIRDFPNASDMVTQYWDNDLAYVTKCALNTCTRQDEFCANTVKHSDTITLQNIFPLRDIMGGEEFFHHTIRSWIDPGEFDKNQIDMFTNESSSRYAAILWCNSAAVGCALAHDSNFYYGACTFGISPKYGEHVYDAGDPCSDCPKNLPCNTEYPGLCGEIGLPRADGASSTYESVYMLLLEVPIILVMYYR